LPGQCGEFQEELAEAKFIFISGHADVPMSVRAMKRGAIEFLTKPVRDQDLPDAIPPRRRSSGYQACVPH
jgi:FixJ family two-component response regulator